MKSTSTVDHERRSSSQEAIDRRFNESLEAAEELDREMVSVSKSERQKRIGGLVANRVAWDFAYDEPSKTSDEVSERLEREP